MFTDSIGRPRRHVTCGRCGNMGPPRRVWSKRDQRWKLTCSWCYDRKVAQLRKRLDAQAGE